MKNALIDFDADGVSRYIFGSVADDAEIGDLVTIVGTPAYVGAEPPRCSGVVVDISCY